MSRTSYHDPAVPALPEAENRWPINLGGDERIWSAAGGGLLTILGLRRGLFSATGLGLTAIGGMLLFRGATGHCPINEAVGRNTASPNEQSGGAVETDNSIVVRKPVAEVFTFWRTLENLPLFMTHLDRVTELDSKRSEWWAKVPGKVATIHWQAEITDERENELIAWRSSQDADIDNAGVVRFHELPDGRGTLIEAEISYRPPAGGLGSVAIPLLTPALKTMVNSDLMRFKKLMEEGPDSQDRSGHGSSEGFSARDRFSSQGTEPKYRLETEPQTSAAGALG